MSLKTVLLIVLFIWGIQSSFIRSKFRKIVYQTNDWKINIKQLFVKEIIALFSNMFPENSNYIKTRDYYRIYLLIHLILFLIYYNI